MKKGFTLIELLVVMFIIAILASLVIVNVNSARKTARDAKRMSDLKSIQGALEMYNNKSGSYPKTFYTKGSAGCDTGFVLSGSASRARRRVAVWLFFAGVQWCWLCRPMQSTPTPGPATSAHRSGSNQRVSAR